MEDGRRCAAWVRVRRAMGARVQRRSEDALLLMNADTTDDADADGTLRTRAGTTMDDAGSVQVDSVRYKACGGRHIATRKERVRAPQRVRMHARTCEGRLRRGMSDVLGVLAVLLAVLPRVL